MRLPQVNQRVCDAIKVAVGRGGSQQDIARAFNFSQACVSQIKMADFDYTKYRGNQIEVLTKLNARNKMGLPKSGRGSRLMDWLFDF